MSSLISFAKRPQTLPRRALGDVLQELAIVAPDQLDHLRAIAEWVLKQSQRAPKAS